MEQKDRIQIDGVWYVREKSIPISKNLIYTWFDGCVVENDKYAFEISRLQKDDDTYYDDISIEFTDKRFDKRENWKVEYWDNNNWMKGVLNNNPVSLEQLKESMDEEDIWIVKDILMKMVEKGWLVGEGLHLLCKT
jgi:hypothetical protein